MMVHLNFLQFILQEGSLYLHWNRTRDIWETLVTNPTACDWDTEVCKKYHLLKKYNLKGEKLYCLDVENKFNLRYFHTLLF